MWMQFISDASVQAAICSPMVTASTPPNDLNFHKPSQNSTASQTGGPWTFRTICSKLCLFGALFQMVFMRQVIMRR